MSLTHTVDSILVRETVLIRERPDTVTVERERTVWRERTLHDTVRVVRTDTVVRTVEVERVVESPPSPLKGGQRTPGWAWLALLALAGLLAAQIIRVKHRLNNH